MGDTFDVLVCGAGPGGAYTAMKLAEKGYNVALFEKADIGRDKSCGAGLTYRISRFPDIFDPEAEYIESSCSRAYVYSANGQAAEAKWDEPIYWNTRRTTFDAYIMKKAVEAGAHFLPHHRIQKISQGEEGVTYVVNGEDFHGKVSVGAGGTNCPVGRDLRKKEGFWEKWPPKAIATAVVEEIPFSPSFIEEHYGEDGLSFLHANFGRLKLGYGWVFPKKDVLNIGYGALTEEMKTVDIRETFWEYLRILEDQGHIPELPKKLNYHGAPIPFYSGLQQTVMDRTILVGDAAGFVNPINGEGIAYAVESGHFAAETIEKAFKKNSFSHETLSRYEEMWRGEFGKELKWLLKFYPIFYKYNKMVIRACQKSRRYTNLLADIFVGRLKADEVRFKIYRGAIWNSIKPGRRGRLSHGTLANEMYREFKKGKKSSNTSVEPELAEAAAP